MVGNKDKELYVNQLLVDIATKIDEDRQNKYDVFTYSKCMNPTLIQQGLQSMNSISALLYLGDYYSVTINVHIESSMIKVRTCEKIRDEFNILYTSDGKWKELSTGSDSFKEGSFKDLGNCFVLDVTTKDIYKKYLNPIGKYKVQELIDIAKSMNLSLEKNGKKKVKKELYDNINFHHLNVK